MTFEREACLRQGTLAAAADEQPKLAHVVAVGNYVRSTTAAIAWPKPMHMQAIP